MHLDNEETMDISFFSKLESLNQNKRYWVAALILKIVYADDKEIPHIHKILRVAQK